MMTVWKFWYLDGLGFGDDSVAHFEVNEMRLSLAIMLELYLTFNLFVCLPYRVCRVFAGGRFQTINIPDTLFPSPNAQASSKPTAITPSNGRQRSYTKP